ncbi:MAG: CopD family protein [Acetobacteraceae bacterium]
MLNGAAPTFDAEGGWILILVRSLWVAALLSAFGSLVFRAYVAPHALRLMPGDAALRVGSRLDRITRASLLGGLAAALAWLALESADMASAGTVAQALGAIPTVLADTPFGHILAIQFGALALAALVLGRGRNRARRWLATGLCTAVAMLQAGHLHAASMYDGPSWLLLAGVLHVLGAGAWLGGLAPLLLIVWVAPAKPAVAAARYFSPLGKLCIVAVLASAAFQAWVMVGSLPGVVGTAYGWVALVKLALFGVLFGFAWFNRYRFAPALARGEPRSARRVLLRSIAAQTGFALAILVAAAVLSSLAPSMHVQPVWPFAERFSLVTVQSDPDFRREVIQAALALAGAAALLVLAVLLRRRVAALAVVAAAVIAWFAVPHLDLLLVEASPTSYYQSPTGFAATAIAQGAALFPDHCAACHGPGGHGDGPAAAGLPVPPADLTAGHLWDHSDGELFWWLTHGIDAPEGGQAMPGFAASLSEDERWDLIDFIRANNAGVAIAATGNWPIPVQAPAFQASCGGKTVTSDDLRGHIVRLVVGDPQRLPPNPDLTTVFITASAASPAACIVSDELAPVAYAVISGIPARDLPGTQFLIDGNGWLRALQRPGPSATWEDASVLASEVRTIREHPITVVAAPPMDPNMKM